MKITIESTLIGMTITASSSPAAYKGEILKTEVTARMWRGVTESGIRCKVFIITLAAADEDSDKFSKELDLIPAMSTAEDEDDTPTNFFSINH